MKPFATIQELKKQLALREISGDELIAFYHQRIKKYNQKLNAFIEVFASVNRMTNAPSSGLLDGIPGVIKDNINQKGHIASCGSSILKNYVAPYDATVVKRIKEAGGVILGRSNMDEFAMGSSGEFSTYGATRNPWHEEYSPGGSSSGSAAAVAAGLVPWALGTETGGSVRQPAAFTGLVGLYPTYGGFSRYGLVAFASSTDQAGPLTKTVYDNALVASALFGHDPKDSTSTSKPQQDFTKYLNGKIPDGLKIGYLEEALTSDGINPEVKATFEQMLKTLEAMGATIKPITLPNLKYGIAVYFVLSRAEAASNLYRYDGTLYGNRAADFKDLNEMYIKTRHDNFGPEVKRRILMGNYVLSSGHRDAFYNKALAVRALLREEFDHAFKEVDLIASPTTSTLPIKLGKELKDPLALYLGDYFTVPNCISGNPAIAFPCGFSSSGLPMGAQFIGPRLAEPLLYQVAYAYEQRHDFYLKTPQGFE